MPDRLVTNSASAQQSLWALDQGGYVTALPLFEAGSAPSKGPLGHLWRADVAVAFVRLNEAAAELELAATGEPEDEVRRALLACEIDLLSGRYDGLKERFAQLVEDAHRHGARALEARALIDLARLARMQSRWRSAIDEAGRAITVATEAGNQYLVGAATWNRAVALAETSDAAQARGDYVRAITQLEATERGRVWASALSSYGAILLASGAVNEALDHLVRSEATFIDLGLVNDALVPRVNLALTRFALGDPAGARTAVTHVIATARNHADARVEIDALRLLACVECVAENFDAGMRAAEEMARLAAARGNEVDRAEAQVVQARLKAKAGDYTALAEIDAIIARYDHAGWRMPMATARVSRADAMMGVDVGRSWASYRKLAAEFAAEQGPLLQAELAALGRALAAKGIFVDGPRLTIDVERLASRTAAHDIADWEMVSQALIRSRGKYAAAGRMIGEKRWNAAFVAKRLAAWADETPERPEDSRRSRAKYLSEDGRQKSSDPDADPVD